MIVAGNDGVSVLPVANDLGFIPIVQSLIGFVADGIECGRVLS